MSKRGFYLRFELYSKICNNFIYDDDSNQAVITLSASFINKSFEISLQDTGIYRPGNSRYVHGVGRCFNVEYGNVDIFHVFLLVLYYNDYGK